MKSKILFLNGQIVTCNEKNESFEAMLVENGKIVSLGSTRELSKFISDSIETIYLDGKTVLPGFYDGHSHINSVALSKMLVPLQDGAVKNISDCIKLLKEACISKPEDEWVLGIGFSEQEVEEKRELTCMDINKVSETRPVGVIDRSLHMIFLNDAGLKALGVTEDTESPEGGHIEKDSKTGKLTGALREEAARWATKEISAMQKTISGITPEAISEASKDYSKKGVTTTSDGALISMGDFNNYKIAKEKGTLKTRIVVNPFWAMNIERQSEFLKEVEECEGNSWVKIGAIKHMYDGTIQHNTAYLTKPYFKPLNGDSKFCGYPSMEKKKMMKDIAFLHSKGYQIFVHGNGDAAIDDLLECFEAVIKTDEDKGKRHCIIHAQAIREDQIEKAKELGIFISLFSPHIYHLGDRHLDTFLGKERAERLSPAASFVKRNMKFTIHCDTPVFPQDPLLAIWAAVNRMTSGGVVLGSQQCISPNEAVKAYTIYAAYQNHEEKERGSLEVGKYADLVILEENPLKCDKQRIKDIKVLGTYIEGQVINN